MRRTYSLLAILLPVIFAMLQAPLMAVPMWTSPDHYRALLTVNPKGVTRKNSPAQVDINFQNILGSSHITVFSNIRSIIVSASGTPHSGQAAHMGDGNGSHGPATPRCEVLQKLKYADACSSHGVLSP